ncbi:MAG: hypothetical protein M3Z04_23000 [Chloroflexota bacterium]|nr:hypothetical protein [Chloroflexota bacterium]
MGRGPWAVGRGLWAVSRPSAVVHLDRWVGRLAGIVQFPCHGRSKQRGCILWAVGGWAVGGGPWAVSRGPWAVGGGPLVVNPELRSP